MLWVTHRGCHVDRTACAWLTRRHLDAVIRGMQLVLPDDGFLIHHADALFDGLHTYLRREVH